MTGFYNYVAAMIINLPYSAIFRTNTVANKIHTELNNMSFLMLIRFEDIEGNILYRDPQIENADDLSGLLEDGEPFARVLGGSSPFSLASTARAIRQVRCVLSVLRPEDVPIIKCVGLNYIANSE